MLDGDSWIFLRKDYKTGQIQKFTQSATSGLGRLEIIQGESGNTRWGTNGEIERPAVSTSDMVQLPDDLRKLAIGETGWSDRRASEMRSLHNLINPSAAKVNTNEKLKQEMSPTGKTRPVP
jgi:hypothetical protein